MTKVTKKEVTFETIASVKKLDKKAAQNVVGGNPFTMRTKYFVNDEIHFD